MFWFDAHGGAGVWRKRVRETKTRVARGVDVWCRLVTKGPISSKCAAWGWSSRRTLETMHGQCSGSRAVPSLLVALTLLSYWQTRYEHTRSISGVPARELVLLFGVLAEL